ncbi:MAG: hypothetical protein PHW74_14800 [Desulfobacca sp.]|nr:hypothetical protein [Desulfobacca sp.]
MTSLSQGRKAIGLRWKNERNPGVKRRLLRSPGFVRAAQRLLKKQPLAGTARPATI